MTSKMCGKQEALSKLSGSVSVAHLKPEVSDRCPGGTEASSVASQELEDSANARTKSTNQETSVPADILSLALPPDGSDLDEPESEDHATGIDICFQGTVLKVLGPAIIEASITNSSKFITLRTNPV